MTSRASLQRQIEDIETRLRALQDRLSDRFSLSARPQVWLAKTVSEVVSGEGQTEEREYPSGTSSTFGIALRRPYFTERIGGQKLEGPLGDDRPQRYALAWPKRYVPENTDSMVVLIDGQYYFVPDGRDVLIVQLDDDLEEAGITDRTVDGKTVECISASHRPATVWAFSDANYLCPTGDRLEWPEGVFNFQTDLMHPASKSSGDPNLILVHREAHSSKWVPFCCSGESPVGPAVGCICVDDENLCFVQVHFRNVKRIFPDDEIGSPPNNTWPDYCNFLNIPRGSGYTGDLCGGSCLDWNNGFNNSGWPVHLVDFRDTGSTVICRYGMYQLGANIQEYNTRGQYPCTQNGENTGFEVEITCPDPTDGSGSAKIRMVVKDCELWVAHLDDITYLKDLTPEGGLPASGTINRVTRIEITNYDVANPNDPFDFCHCLLETTRLDLDQGSFNASTGSPNLQHGAPLGVGCTNPATTPGDRCVGHNYVVSVAGTHDFGDGGVSLQVNDLVVYDDRIWKWVVIPNSGGLQNDKQFAPVEVTRFIDSDGCDWGDTIKNADIYLVFRECPPP